jgi:hypothetical protein
MADLVGRICLAKCVEPFHNFSEAIFLQEIFVSFETDAGKKTREPLQVDFALTTLLLATKRPVRPTVQAAPRYSPLLLNGDSSRLTKLAS